MRFWLWGGVAVFVLPLLASVLVFFANSDAQQDWRSARRDSTGLAPDPQQVREAVIQVYAARAYNWRGIFGVHTWVAAKPQNASAFTRFEVMGFSVANGQQAVRVHEGVPDGYWFGNHPVLLRDVRGGDEVDALIVRLHQAAAEYPFPDQYRIWPGPNSNTFIAYLGRMVPELQLELPANAIGKDFPPTPVWLGKTVSGTGVQLSLGGLLGVSVALEEGLEVNLLGLTAGVDAWPPALKLPGIGRLGMQQHAPDSNWRGSRRLPS